MVVLTVVYQFVFGVYDEIPADLYQHLRKTSDYFRLIERNGFDLGTRGFTELIFSAARIWYTLLSWCALSTGESIQSTFEITMFVCPILFLIGVASCADRLFVNFSFSPQTHQIAVLLAVFFVFAQMGINVYAFIRYYAYAPTMVNFIAYFTGLICLLNLYENIGGVIRNLALVLISTIVGLMVHTQEGLFVIVAATLLGMWWATSQVIQYIKSPKNRIKDLILPGLLGGLIILGFFCLVVLIRLEFDLRPFDDNRLIALPFALPVFGQLFILDPSYQFFRVVTIWGVAVYVLFFLFYKEMLKQPFLVAGMLSPILTVFNPLFADIFLHLKSSTTLWRLCYLIPLHFVAAVIIIMLFEKARAASVMVRCSVFPCIILLFLLLLPSSIVPLNNYGKITLGKVEGENNWYYWKDLIDFLNQNPPKDLGVKSRVLADPITGYMLGAFTKYTAFNFKFLPTQAYYVNSFVHDEYDGFPLDRFSGKMLIVNSRDGGLSKSGLISGHWHKRVLSVSEYYPEKLIAHLEAYPDKFETLWAGDKITVYKVR